MLFPGARAANTAADSFDTRPAALALDELRRAWLGQLNELISTARELAVFDDTYEFVKRPNIPYVYAHYDPVQLAAERIDTVLIINLRGKPLFWRRLNQGENRGFPDARRFLAELPPLQSVGAAGMSNVADRLTWRSDTAKKPRICSGFTRTMDASGFSGTCANSSYRDH